ncbi:MAG: ABC transporter substrate-binding protein [Candidatus Methanosuratincola petrocarbonis]
MLLAAFIVVSCAYAEYPMTITDSAGREVTIQMPVERIIVLNSDAAEAVAILGCADKIVGVSDTVKNKEYYFPQLKDRQYVGKWSDPDYEMIAEIAKIGDEIIPDILVITYTSPGKPYGVEEVDRKLAQFGIPVVGLDLYKPETMISEILTLGKILDREVEAKRYIEWYEGVRADVERAVEKSTTVPKVYAESTSKGGEYTTHGPGSGMDQLVSMARGLNVANDLTGAYPVVSWEWVISQNPDIIIKKVSYTDKTPYPFGWERPPSVDSVKLEGIRNEIIGRTGSGNINAVKNGRVYLMNWEITAGLDDVVGLAYMAKLIHPDINLDPVGIYKEYLHMLGVEYPENRIFVYPEI